MNIRTEWTCQESISPILSSHICAKFIQKWCRMQALAYENEFPTRGSKFCFFIGNPKMIGQLSLGIELTQRYLGRRKQNFFSQILHSQFQSWMDISEINIGQIIYQNDSMSKSKSWFIIFEGTTRTEPCLQFHINLKFSKSPFSIFYSQSFMKY